MLVTLVPGTMTSGETTVQHHSIDLFSNRKICRRCGEDKPLDQFETYDNGAGPRHRGTCSKCSRSKAPEKTLGFKECKDCGEILPVAEFYHGRKANGKKYPTAYCKACCTVKRKDYSYQPASKSALRKRNLKRDFGITVEQYEALFQAQSGVCAICGKPETRPNPDGTIRRLAVDHCHVTNKVRGLCCSHCNCGLGHFFDNAQMMRKAADYLDKYQLG